jgi:hypothetical protein
LGRALKIGERFQAVVTSIGQKSFSFVRSCPVTNAVHVNQVLGNTLQTGTTSTRAEAVVQGCGNLVMWRVFGFIVATEVR